MKQITIIGAGFAALSAVRKLRQLDDEAEITLIPPKAELVFLPSLIWIPSGMRKAEDLRIPLDHFMRDNRIRFVAGEATGLENGGRTVLTNNGKVVNDGLIIASGGRFINLRPERRGASNAQRLCGKALFRKSGLGCDTTQRWGRMLHCCQIVMDTQ